MSTRITCFCWLFLFTIVDGHLPSYVSTPSNKIEQFCSLADACIHDTIPICGKMEKEMRTFMDLCDLLEYICDTNEIYLHVDDTVGCPDTKKSKGKR